MHYCPGPSIRIIQDLGLNNDSRPKPSNEPQLALVTGCCHVNGICDSGSGGGVLVMMMVMMVVMMMMVMMAMMLMIVVIEMNADPW